MKFGLLYGAGPLAAEPTASRHDVLQEALVQVRLAEALGFHSVWSIDRGGSGSAASAPEMWLAAVAQHTERMRIGHGIRSEPFAYDNPIRIAERAAVLDIVSDGRLELGTGPLPDVAELEVLGLGAEALQAHWDEALRMLVGMWTEDAFSWASERFSMPPRNVLPKPLQRPHPPLWMSGSDPAAAAFAGERGLGFMLVGLDDDGDLAHLARVHASHRAALLGAQPAAGGLNERFAVVTPLIGANDGDGGVRRVLDGCDASEPLGIDAMLFAVPVGAMQHADILDALRHCHRALGRRLDG